MVGAFLACSTLASAGQEDDGVCSNRVRGHDRSEKSVRSLLSLAFLAPDIVEAAVMNRLPRGFGITDLTDLPAGWIEQRRQLALV